MWLIYYLTRHFMSSSNHPSPKNPLSKLALPICSSRSSAQWEVLGSNSMRTGKPFGAQAFAPHIHPLYPFLLCRHHQDLISLHNCSTFHINFPFPFSNCRMILTRHNLTPGRRFWNNMQGGLFEKMHEFQHQLTHVIQMIIQRIEEPSTNFGK